MANRSFVNYSFEQSHEKNLPPKLRGMPKAPFFAGYQICVSIEAFNGNEFIQLPRGHVVTKFAYQKVVTILRTLATYLGTRDC